MESNYRVVRTIRCKNANIPGTLGKLATVIGLTGSELRNISTVHLGHRFNVRDIEVFCKNINHFEQLVKEISELEDTSVLQIRDDVLELHRNGKIKMINTVPINSLDDLHRVYTPGVAEVCRLIMDQESWKYTYTNIGYSVAIVTDGSAVLGWGNIGPAAGMPVMEGKAALLQQLVGISGIPILLNTTDQDEIVETVKHISPTFGGIQLEDIASPRCFYIEERLKDELSVPVMHDDQHVTAVVTLAALINACRLSGITLEEAKIGLIGLGAAGLSIGKFLLRFTGNPALGTAKTEASIRRHQEHGGIPSNLNEIMKTADIVIATTGVEELIEPEMVRDGQIIFALSNPRPEIVAELARSSGAALAVDGTTVNNLMGYPGIWRGTLDVQATEINYEMYKAAALAIAGAAHHEEIVPSLLDPKVHLAVTHSVAKAAMESGVAKRPLDDDYFEDNTLTAPLWE